MALIGKTVKTDDVSVETLIEYAETISGQSIVRRDSEGYDLRWEFKSDDHYAVNIKAKSDQLKIYYYWSDDPSLYRLILFRVKKLSKQENTQGLSKPLPWSHTDIIAMDENYSAIAAKDARWIWGYIYIGIVSGAAILVLLVYVFWRLF